MKIEIQIFTTPLTFFIGSLFEYGFFMFNSLFLNIASWCRKYIERNIHVVNKKSKRMPKIEAKLSIIMSNILSLLLYIQTNKTKQTKPNAMTVDKECVYSQC